MITKKETKMWDKYANDHIADASKKVNCGESAINKDELVQKIHILEKKLHIVNEMEQKNYNERMKLEKKLCIAMNALAKASTETEQGFITTCSLCGSPVKFHGYNPAWVCIDALNKMGEVK